VSKEGSDPDRASCPGSGVMAAEAALQASSAPGVAAFHSQFASLL
jgi:hypothetical protein